MHFSRLISWTLLSCSMLSAVSAQEPVMPSDQAAGQDSSSTTPSRPDPSLADLAAQFDLVAIAQVTVTDYQKTREFPSSGSAYLTALIPYKGIEKGQLIEVTEKGLDADACYYPEIEVLQMEGHRFLVFLNKDSNKADSYHGYLPYCQIPVFVTSDNSYAIGAPVFDLSIPDEIVQPVTFGDPAAVIDLTEWPRPEADRFVESFDLIQIPPREDQPENTRLFMYTQGIRVDGLHKLLFPDGQPFKPRNI